MSVGIREAKARLSRYVTLGPGDMKRRSSVVRFWILLGGACGTSSSPDGGGPSIHATDFDRKCTQPSDCVAVEDDTPCCNVCPNAAVSKAGLSAFNAEFSKQAAACTPQDRQCAQIACNTASHPTCSAGTCVFVSCIGTLRPDADAGDASTD